MNKVVVIMISIVVIISAIFTAIAIMKSNEEGIQNGAKVAEEILDDCTEEYETMQQETTSASSSEEKTSPNCSLTIKTFFNGCRHIISKYSNLPADLVNLTQKELQEKYPDYKITVFTSSDVILYQEKDGECGEHYMLKDNNGTVSIYKILSGGALEKIEDTSICTEYLPEADKANIEKGIEVNGEQNLNQLLEDFE